MKKYTIRTEQPRDFKIVENLTREAFWNVYRPGCVEHFVLHHYRNNPEFIPELSLVMEVDGQIIGHVMYAWSKIDADDGRKIRMMTFGPISIHPAYQHPSGLQATGIRQGAPRLFHGTRAQNGRRLPAYRREHRILRQERIRPRLHQRHPLRRRPRQRRAILLVQGTGRRFLKRSNGLVQRPRGLFRDRANARRIREVRSKLSA